MDFLRRPPPPCLSWEIFTTFNFVNSPKSQILHISENHLLRFTLWIPQKVRSRTFSKSIYYNTHCKLPKKVRFSTFLEIFTTFHVVNFQRKLYFWETSTRSEAKMQEILDLGGTSTGSEEKILGIYGSRETSTRSEAEISGARRYAFLNFFILFILCLYVGHPDR